LLPGWLQQLDGQLGAAGLDGQREVGARDNVAAQRGDVKHPERGVGAAGRHREPRAGGRVPSGTRGSMANMPLPSASTPSCVRGALLELDTVGDAGESAIITPAESRSRRSLIRHHRIQPPGAWHTVYTPTKGMTGWTSVIYEALHLTEISRMYDDSVDQEGVVRGSYSTNEHTWQIGKSFG